LFLLHDQHLCSLTTSPSQPDLTPPKLTGYYSPPEEHDRTGIKQFIHVIEVRYFLVVDEVDDGEFFNFVCNLVEELVHGYALGV